MNILHPPNQLTERILTLIKVCVIHRLVVYPLWPLVQESLLLKPLLVSIAQFDLQVSEYKEFLCQLRYIAYFALNNDNCIFVRNCFPCHNAKLLPYVFFRFVTNIIFLISFVMQIAWCLISLMRSLKDCANQSLHSYNHVFLITSN